jgi:hypothetical protein
MRFLAQYINRKADDVIPYYRTVFGDDINEALRIAERYTRKGYIMARLTQQI